VNGNPSAIILSTLDSFSRSFSSKSGRNSPAEGSTAVGSGSREFERALSYAQNICSFSR